MLPTTSRLMAFLHILLYSPTTMLATVSRRKAVDAHYDLLCGMGLFHASVLETDKRKTAFDSMLSKDSVN